MVIDPIPKAPKKPVKKEKEALPETRHTPVRPLVPSRRCTWLAYWQRVNRKALKRKKRWN